MDVNYRNNTKSQNPVHWRGRIAIWIFNSINKLRANPVAIPDTGAVANLTKHQPPTPILEPKWHDKRLSLGHWLIGYQTYAACRDIHQRGLLRRAAPPDYWSYPQLQ